MTFLLLKKFYNLELLQKIFTFFNFDNLESYPNSNFKFIYY